MNVYQMYQVKCNATQRSYQTYKIHQYRYVSSIDKCYYHFLENRLKRHIIC